ncbi:aspartate kinase [Halalkalibaculum sp. DA3122]|uniref:aspartate kinase n=1 Tax=unclassified Halalkalibaculum TaxID=2964617 RepID=UPI0037546D4E
MKTTRVLKFGGTSMGDEHTWRMVLEIVKQYEQPVVVVSATSRTTRQLLAAVEAAPDRYERSLEISSEIRSRHETLIRRFLQEFDHHDAADALEQCLAWIEKKIRDLNRHLREINKSKKTDAARKDAVASIGEQLSSGLFATCGKVFGLNTTFMDARDIIKTNSDFGHATPDLRRINQQARKIRQNIEQSIIPVIGGYYGENDQGELTTLGFEGSDYTASLIGAALNCEAIEIWTDVSGIFTCDPRVVEEARPIPEISFREATEMAYFGARVLHPSTLKPAAQKEIPVYVRNIFDPGHPGTKIYSNAESGRPVRALAFLEDVVIITVNAPSTLMGFRFLSNVFQILEHHHITVDVVTTTEASVSIALERPEKLDLVINELQGIGEVTITEQQGLVSLIGFGLSNVESITSRVFSSVRGGPLSLISFSRDKRNLNLVLPEQQLIATVRSLHRSLFRTELSSTS